MALVRTKPGVELLFTDATMQMVSTLRKLAADLPIDFLWVTSGIDGEHSGPNDPHHHGAALDIRTHNFPTRGARYDFCAALQLQLTKTFYCFVEHPDTDGEHIHVQVAKGKTYPPAPVNGAAARNA
jgi:hypothetical protein